MGRSLCLRYKLIIIIISTNTHISCRSLINVPVICIVMYNNIKSLSLSLSISFQGHSSMIFNGFKTSKIDNCFTQCMSTIVLPNIVDHLPKTVMVIHHANIVLSSFSRISTFWKCHFYYTNQYSRGVHESIGKFATWPNSFKWWSILHCFLIDRTILS